MNILIIENEIYLAQKVVSRLLDDGHSCDYIESPNIDNLTKDYDTILLSRSLPTSLCKNIIKRDKHAIVELKASYIHAEESLLKNGDILDANVWKPLINNFRSYHGITKSIGRNFRFDN